MPLFPDGVGPNFFSGGSVAPNAKFYQSDWAKNVFSEHIYCTRYT